MVKTGSGFATMRSTKYEAETERLLREFSILLFSKGCSCEDGKPTEKEKTRVRKYNQLK